MNAPSDRPSLEPVEAEERAGLDSAKKLAVGTGSFDLTAGVDERFSGGLNAFVRGDVEWHPLETITGFAFAQADLDGVSAGIGIKGTF